MLGGRPDPRSPCTLSNTTVGISLARPNSQNAWRRSSTCTARASSLCKLPSADRKLTYREGIMALQAVEMRDLYDLKVFVNCDSDLMLARRIRRDTVERGRDVNGILDQVSFVASNPAHCSTCASSN